MTPETPSDKPAPNQPRIRSFRRSELTRELISSHRAVDIPLPAEEAKLTASARAGAQWFYWIAALSVINAVLSLTGSHITFLAGLAVTQMVDVFAAHFGFVSSYIDLAINLVIASVLCGFGYLTTHGSRAAFVAGMILYAFDGVLCFLLSNYGALLLHGFILVQMMIGWRARQELALRQDEHSMI